MEAAFWYKIGLSFAVGSAWVTLSTLLAERFGSKVGGLIGGLPSTALVTLLFIGLTQSPAVAVEATMVMPLSQGLNGITLIVYILLARRGLWAGLAGALACWFTLAGCLAASGVHSMGASVAGWALLVTGCYLVLEKCMQIPSQGKINLRYGAPQIVLRALFGGAVIAFAVSMGRLAGPIYGGIFGTFPALFISTLFITYRSGGAEFSRAVAKALAVSGTVNVALYAMMVHYLYAWVGLACGTAIAIALSCGMGYLTYLFMRTRVS